MHSAALSHWLHLLWGPLPPVQLAPSGVVHFIEGGHIHLPATADWHAQQAAAAHAAAHLVYSPAGGFDAEGLVPIARTLLATLEDARVEALAMRELPGLARLWRPLHTATPDSGEGFEPLLQRLARALVDPAYEDPHAWVRKGRQLFYVDAGLGMLALRTPAELRAAAMTLGRDIGQARLPFNVRTHRPAPGYRDDHRWMWPADQLQPVTPPPSMPEAVGSSPSTAAAPSERPPVSATLHPEWDHLIHRLRPDWVTVFEQPPDTRPPAAPATRSADPSSTATARLLPALQRLTTAAGPSRLAREGEAPDLDALVAWQMARREGRAGDARVFRTRRPRRSPAQVWLLVDQSASATDRAHRGEAHHAAGPDARLVDVASDAALALVLALRRLHVSVAVSGFHSHGRHAVSLHTVQGLDEAAVSTPTLSQRLRALRCGGSTRVGAVLRHAAQRLGARRGGERWVLMLSDAQAHDIDVHDPHYLPADARHAVRAGARRGVKMACLVLVPSDARRAAERPDRPSLPAIETAASAARSIFGPRAVQALPSTDHLAGALRRLLA